MQWGEVRADVEARVAEGYFKRKKKDGVRAVSLSGKTRSWPFTRSEWLHYSYKLWAIIQVVINTRQVPPWETLHFREEDDFYAGSYSDFKIAWLPAINVLPGDKIKDLAYNLVHVGVDLFPNLEHIDFKRARRFRGKQKIYTKYITHPYNRELRQKGCYYQGLKGIRSRKVYQRVVTPMGSDKDGKPINFRLKNSNKLLLHSAVIMKHIKKLIDNGSIELLGKVDEVPPDEVLLCSGLVIVPKGDDWRVCYDGGPLKSVEKFSVPCSLDSMIHVLRYIQKDDYLLKYDDKSGFYQLMLSLFSRNLACFEWGGYYFRYIAAAFGLPRIPGDFQLANSVGVSYLRTLGILAFLYLDDRLIIERGLTPMDITEIKSGKKASFGAFICNAVQIALGGFISRAKSTYIPSKNIVFLGFELDTGKETIRIPEDKWEKFISDCEKILSKQQIPFKQLERLRGKMCSMMLVVRNMRLYIRRITEALKEAESEHASTINVTRRIRSEIKTWMSLKYITKVRPWLTPGLNNVVLKIYTDASNFAAGVVIESLKIDETIYWDSWVKDKPIHIKEAFAIKLVLMQHGSLLRNKRINFLCDNVAVVKTFESGATNPLLNNIIREINELAMDLNAAVTIEWISTKVMEDFADRPSRAIDIREEILGQEEFDNLELKLGWKFTLDAAARFFNTKVPGRYISIYPEDSAWKRDFMTVMEFDEDEVIFAFPPIAMTDVFYFHLQKVGKNLKWCLIFHVFEDFPLFVAETAHDSSFSIISLGTADSPCSYLPSVKKDPIRGYFMPNVMAIATYALIHS